MDVFKTAINNLEKVGNVGYRRELNLQINRR